MKKLRVFMLLAITLLFVVKPLPAHAEKRDGNLPRFVLSVTYDTGNKKYNGTVLYSKDGGLELKSIGMYNCNGRQVIDVGENNGGPIPVNNLQPYIVDADGKKSTYGFSGKFEEKGLISKITSLYRQQDKKVRKVENDLDGELGTPIFSFPCYGLNTPGDATDQALANRVIDCVVEPLNNAIDWCISQVGVTKSSLDNSEVMSLAALLANNVTSSGGSDHTQFTWKGVTFSFAGVDDSFQVTNNDMSSKYFSRITNKNTNESACFQWQVAKGYLPTDFKDSLSKSASISTKDKDFLKEVYTPVVLSWKDVVRQAHGNAEINGVIYSNLETLQKPGIIEQYVIDTISDALASLRGVLGLSAIEDLMSNQGMRDTGYYLGIFKNSWKTSGYLMYYICSVIAWSFLAFSLVKLINKRQLATMNVVERVEMKEGIRNIVITAAILGFFPLLFDVIAKLNYSLVQLFTSGVDGVMNLGQNAGPGTIGSVIISIACFALCVYYNFFYMMRAISTLILFVIAPFCIYSISLGKKSAGIFTNYSKELVGNIFIQSIHALLLAVFSTLNTNTTLSAFEMFVVVYSFIPITKLVRDKLFQVGGGLSDEAGGTLGGFAIGTGIGLATSAVGGMTSHAGVGPNRGGDSSGRAGSKEDNSIFPDISPMDLDKSPKGGKPKSMKDNEISSEVMYNGTKTGGSGVLKKDNQAVRKLDRFGDWNPEGKSVRQKISHGFKNADKEVFQKDKIKNVGSAVGHTLAGGLAASAGIGLAIAGNKEASSKVMASAGEHLSIAAETAGTGIANSASNNISRIKNRAIRMDAPLESEMKKNGVAHLYTDGNHYSAEYECQVSPDSGEFAMKDGFEKNITEENAMKDFSHLITGTGRYRDNEQLQKDAWKHYNNMGIVGGKLNDIPGSAERALCVTYIKDENKGVDPFKGATAYSERPKFEKKEVEEEKKRPRNVGRYNERRSGGRRHDNR